ncbi:GTP pyrophosphokinase, partial [Streptomyces sp. AcH 505]
MPDEAQPLAAATPDEHENRATKASDAPQEKPAAAPEAERAQNPAQTAPAETPAP